MKIKIWHILILILAACFIAPGYEALARSSKKPELLLKKADRCRKSLYRSSGDRKYRHNWLKCVHKYEIIYKRFPKNDQAAWAMYHSAHLYTHLYTYSGKSKDLDEAVRLYKRLTDKYPGHRLADDAQYLIGEIYYKYKKDYPQAYVEFLKMDIKFPSGDMRPRAKKRLDQLSLILSKKKEKAIEKKAGSKVTLVSVKDIRHWSTSNYTRVVIDLDGPTKYKHHLLKKDPSLKKPCRLYLDLKNTRVTSRIDREIPIKDGLLLRSRAGQYTKNSVRVVLDTESIGGYKVFHLYDPFRIVVDVRKLENGAPKTGSVIALKKRKARKGVRRTRTREEKVSLARQLGLNVKRIVIDPGHGGKDPGCILGKKLREKDLVLSIAKKVAKKIKKETGCEVILTRNRDIFLSLEQRTAIANMKKADLFISIHVNAHRSRKVWGLETYYLNMATDERSVMVAARENATSEKNISDLQVILNDLMLNTKINESSQLAFDIQKGMISKVGRKYKRVRSLGVKQAPFYVLIGAQMPAILVETGFITNQMERKRLVSNTYQECVAEGICTGIRSYINGIALAYKGV